MKKRFLACLLSLCMLLTLAPAAFAADESTAITAEMTTLASGTYALTGDVLLTGGALTVPSGATVTIDLAGHTLSPKAGCHTIVNQGTLTIQDSGETSGTVKSDVAGKSALQNEPGAIATINGGKFYKSLNVNSNDYYVITNHGKLTINDGIIESESSHSSAIENGWYTPGQNTGKVFAELTIKGGEVSSLNASGGLYTLKNDDYGIMTIEGGTFTNTVSDCGTVLNWNELTVKGGIFHASGAAIATMAEGSDGKPKYSYEQGITTISGGTLNGSLATNTSYSAAITWNITGGTFSADVSSLLGADYACTKNTGSNTYSVDLKSTITAEAEVKNNTIHASIGGEMLDTSEENLNASGKTLTVNAKAEDAGSATAANITIGGKALQAIDTDPSVSTVAIETNVATLSIDADAWSAITENAATGEEETAVSDVTLEVSAADQGSDKKYTLTATDAAGNEIFGEADAKGSITVSAPFAGETAVVYYIAPTGYQKVDSTLKDGVLSWTVRHFSEYLATSSELNRIAAFGFQETGEGANQVFNALVQELDTADGLEPSTPVTDSDKNTMYVVLDNRSAGNAYTIVVSKDGTEINNYTFPTGKGANYRAIRFTFERSDHVGENTLQAGEYTAVLKLNDTVLDTKTLTLLSAQSFVDDWTAYTTEPLGQVTVPGSTMKYSEVPDINAVIAGGYSALWATEWADKDVWSDTLAAYKADLLDAVKTYNRFLLDTVYHNGEGITVGDTTYYMPEQAYTTAKSAIECAADLAGALNAYQTALNGQYTDSSAALIAAGFQASGDAANAAINAQIKAMNGPEEAYVSDSDQNTMYFAIQGNGTAADYTYKVTNAEGEIVTTGDQTVTNGAVVYFTFEREDHTTTELKPGAYTISLYPKGGSDPINALELTLGNATFDANGGKPEDIAPVFAVAGDSVSLPSVTKSGYRFGGWKDADGTTHTGTLTMPSGTTPLTAQWSRNTGSGGVSTSYTVSVANTTNGKVTASSSRASDGTTVTITAIPDSGYAIGAVNVTDGKGTSVKTTEKSSGIYTFIMPSSNVTVSVSFAASTGLPFTDVTSSDWYYAAVKYVYDNHLMQGVGDTSFAPTAKLTRGMIAQVLYNMEGKPAVSVSAAFNDVAAGVWYTDAVNWAASKQIVSGYGNGKFGPADNITREQMAVILYNYATYKGYDTTQGGMAVREFSDAEKISTWAESAMNWAVHSKLLSGKGNGLLDPTGTASRSEVAQILKNFGETIQK